ncbi:putative SP-containing membrane protein [Vairimorpha necatrix]|uniref:SP-containing membrane protein n=1 Tax=Vairimorpha necatrix TaxID=6039 RepID=A0AAX4J8D5_9MICR
MNAIIFYFGLSTFIATIITTKINQKILLNKIKDINSAKNCYLFESQIHDSDLSLDEVQYIGHTIWRELTNKKEFRKTLKTNNLDGIFNDKKEYYFNKYINKLLIGFNLKSEGTKTPELIKDENGFIEQTVFMTQDILRSLNLCYKDTISKAKSFKDIIHKIFEKNLCLKHYGKDKLPGVFHRHCGDFAEHYINCKVYDSLYMKQWFEKHREFLSPRRCIENNIDSDNGNTKFTTYSEDTLDSHTTTTTQNPGNWTNTNKNNKRKVKSTTQSNITNSDDSINTSTPTNFNSNTDTTITTNSDNILNTNMTNTSDLLTSQNINYDLLNAHNSGNATNNTIAHVDFGNNNLGFNTNNGILSGNGSYMIGSFIIFIVMLIIGSISFIFYRRKKNSAKYSLIKLEKNIRRAEFP